MSASQDMLPRQVAAVLRCSFDEVRELIASGQLHTTNVGFGNNRSRRLVTGESLEKFLKRRQAKHAAAVKRMAQLQP